MAIKVFYAWQSDRPAKANRNFIRAALDDAAKEIGKDLDLADAVRAVQIDQDTQGVPGSPPIAETILAKIRAADLFVADLTFVNDPAEQGRRMPNPNVMLEYGYALHALGDGRLISVLNEHYGPASKLPFDIVHRRWPIRYNLPSKADSEIRSAIRRQLKADLVLALRTASPKSLQKSTPAAFKPAEPQDGIGCFVKPGGRLAVRADGEPVTLLTGAYAFLRLIPTHAASSPLTNVQAAQLTQKGLLPLGSTEGGIWWGRNELGAAVFSGGVDPSMAWRATQLFKTRELWGLDFHLLREGKPPAEDIRYIPSGAVEQRYAATLKHFMRFAQTELALELPIRIVAGLVGIEGMFLAVDQRRYDEQFAGPIVVEHVTIETSVTDWDADPEVLLGSWFTEIFDAAGLERRPSK